MHFSGLLRFIDALASIATVATTALVFLAWKQIKLVKEQATTSFEDGLTEHYRRIMESIPINIWLGEGLQTLDQERQNRCRDAIYRYIDLCQEQMFLHESGRVTEATWVEWESGIRCNMEVPAFKQIWHDVEVKLPESFLELRKFLSSQQFTCRVAKNSK
ncbi:MAG: hypothetical protein ACLQVM_13310 [Terriglobia bacterium]